MHKLAVDSCSYARNALSHSLSLCIKVLQNWKVRPKTWFIERIPSRIKVKLQQIHQNSCFRCAVTLFTFTDKIQQFNRHSLRASSEVKSCNPTQSGRFLSRSITESSRIDETPEEEALDENDRTSIWIRNDKNPNVRNLLATTKPNRLRPTSVTLQSADDVFDLRRGARQQASARCTTSVDRAAAFYDVRTRCDAGLNPVAYCELQKQRLREG